MLPHSRKAAKSLATRGVAPVLEFLLPGCTSVVMPSPADAVPGLSTGSAVGALVADACTCLSVSCAIGAFAAVGDTGVVFHKKHVVER